MVWYTETSDFRLMHVIYRLTDSLHHVGNVVQSIESKNLSLCFGV